MTEDAFASIGDIASKSSRSKAFEKVEQAYKNVRDTTVEEFSGHDDFGFGTGGDDFSWG